MTEIATPAADTHASLQPESFWAVVLRRSRYVLAILLAGILFCTLGWSFAAPPPEWAGVSLVAWQNHSVLSAFYLTFLLLIATGACSLLVHPESPHMGLACALLGMAALSIRGGSIYMLIRYAQLPGQSFVSVSQGLALECIEWGIILMIAEVFGRLLHDRFFVNQHWIMRSGPDLGGMLMQGRHGAHNTPMGVALAVSKFFQTEKLNRIVATPLAMFCSGVLSFLMLYAFMQTQQKGQVLMACFVSFYISTFLTYLVFPTVPILAMLLVVPLTAATAYVYGMNVHLTYPGHVPFFAMRALPIDYATAGIPGAIFGYYGGFRWALHSVEE